MPRVYFPCITAFCKNDVVRRRHGNHINIPTQCIDNVSWGTTADQYSDSEGCA